MYIYNIPYRIFRIRVDQQQLRGIFLQAHQYFSSILWHRFLIHELIIKCCHRCLHQCRQLLCCALDYILRHNRNQGHRIRLDQDGNNVLLHNPE